MHIIIISFFKNNDIIAYELLLYQIHIDLQPPTFVLVVFVSSTPFFECGKLKDACKDELICVNCVSSSFTIAWALNYPLEDQCTTQFGSFHENGTERSLTGNNCTARAILIDKNPLVSRLCFTAKQGIKNVSCSAVAFSDTSTTKTCSITIKSKNRIEFMQHSFKYFRKT